jgi:acyl carrier protein
VEAAFQRLARVAAARYRRDAGALRPEDDIFLALDIDSVEALELVSALELEFGVEIPDHELLSVRTLGQLAAVLEGRTIR